MTERAASDLSSRMIVAGITAVIGILVGAILSFLHIESIWDVLSLSRYGHWMLVPLTMAAVSLGIVIVEAIRTRELRMDTVVIGCLAIAAAASPLTAMVAGITLLVGIVALAVS